MTQKGLEKWPQPEDLFPWLHHPPAPLLPLEESEDSSEARGTHRTNGMGEEGPQSGDQFTPATPHCHLGGGGGSGGEEGTEEVHYAVGGGGEIV